MTCKVTIFLAIIARLRETQGVFIEKKLLISAIIHNFALNLDVEQYRNRISYFFKNHFSIIHY